MKAAHHIFEYLTAVAVVVLFSAVILFFPEMGQASLPTNVSGVDGGGETTEQPAASVTTPQTKVEGRTHG